MSEFDRINHIANETNTNDFRMESFDGATLVITGSFDFVYYHEVEVIFSEVSYISLPTDFHYPLFRLATEEERARVRTATALEPEDIVYCIEAETTSSIERLPFFIVAQKMEVSEGTVYHYQRDDLKPGERIAPWVPKGGGAQG